MLEKIKTIPFIDESSAVKITTEGDNKIFLERTDRVVWAKEATNLRAEGILCYVEASKFFALLPEIDTISQDTCLKVTLKNGAKYDLPFLEVSWEPVALPTEYADTINFKLGDLMLCTLKNLIKPELQCIYIDNQGAVSCDFLSACISKEVKATTPLLLPEDVQELVNGRECKVLVEGDKIYINAHEFDIVTTNPTMGEDSWWEDLRSMLDADGDVVVATDKLSESLKRLALFGDYLSFDGEKVIVETNNEPFVFERVGESLFEIEKISKLLTTATKLTRAGDNIVLKNEGSKFLVSPMEEV